MSNKCSYLDGVPFGINPIFIKSDKTWNEKKDVNEGQSIVETDLTQALSFLNFSHDFLHEAQCLMVDKKQRKKLSKASKKQQAPINGMKTIAHESASLNSNTNTLISQIGATAQNYINTQGNIQTLSTLDQAPNSFNLYASTMPVSNLHPSLGIPYSNGALLEPTRSIMPKATSSELQPTMSNQCSIKSSLRQDSLQDMFNPVSSLDPFNDMELKTINDLEELKTILHNHQLDTQQVSAENAQYPEQQHQKHDNSTMNYKNTSHEVDSGSVYGSKLNYAQKQMSQCVISDNFGLPKVSFIDLDINSNKL